MKIQVLRRTEYKGCNVYILRIGIIFQYLFVFKNEIFQDHIFWKPSWYAYLLRFAGLASDFYSKDDLDDGEGIILNGALSSIDMLTAPGAAEKMNEVREKAKKL